MSIDRKTFQFKRGDDFSCYVTITDKGESVTLHNVVFPADATADVIEQFAEDAEKAARKQLEKTNGSKVS